MVMPVNGHRAGGAMSARAMLTVTVTLLLISTLASCQAVLRAPRALEPAASDAAVPATTDSSTGATPAESAPDSSSTGMDTTSPAPDRSSIEAVLAAANNPEAGSTASDTPTAATSGPTDSAEPEEVAAGGAEQEDSNSTAGAGAATAEDTQGAIADSMENDITDSEASGTTAPTVGQPESTAGTSASPSRPNSSQSSQGPKQAGVAGRAGFIATGAKPAKVSSAENVTYCLTAADMNSTSTSTSDAESSNKSAAVELQTCDASVAGQAWQLRFNGQLNVVGTEVCLDSASAKKSSKIVVATCNRESLTQKWFLDGVGRLHPYASPDMCIDVAAAASGNASSQAYDPKSGFVLAECSLTRGSQYFAAAGLYPADFRASKQRIGLRANQHCMDTYDYKSGREVKVRPAVLNQCGPEIATQFWTYGVTTGYLANTGIEPVNTYCMVAANETVGAAVRVKKCGEKANTMPEDLNDTQRWFRDAFLRLRPYSAPKLCLDVIQNSFLPKGTNKDVTVQDNDVVLILNKCKASATQQWLGEQPSRAPNGTAGAGGGAGAGTANGSAGQRPGGVGATGLGGLLGQRQGGLLRPLTAGQTAGQTPGQTTGGLGGVLGRLAGAAAERTQAAGDKPGYEVSTTPVAAASSEGASEPRSDAASVDRP